MKAMAIFGMLCGVLAILSFWLFSSDKDREAAQSKSVAVNYAVYRNAVFAHVIAHTRNALPEELNQADLSLPSGWQAIRQWRHRIETTNAGKLCYVFGPAQQAEITAIRDLFLGSFAVGHKHQGQLVPAHGASMPLPGYIPEGHVVSVIEVNP